MQEAGPPWQQAAAKVRDDTTLSWLRKHEMMPSAVEDEDPRVRAMQQAIAHQQSRGRMQVPPGTTAGQEEADWADVVQYWRGVGGNALRLMGVDQQDVRNLGLV
jgi:hypothetical protein